MADTLKESGISDEDVRECAETFVLNAKYVGVLKDIAGAERLIPIDQVIEEMPRDTGSGRMPAPVSKPDGSGKAVVGQDNYWETTCFYITAIGDEGSEFRKHSDLFLGSIVEPALEQFGFKVVRADAIDKPGMITNQVIEHILRCKMVVADLSFHNPNVFYELCLRHATRLPVVQLIRAGERIPFDINQFRTVVIDTSSIFSLVPRLELHKAEIANQVRRALEDPDSAASNPLITFFPSINLQFEGKTG